MDYLFEYARRSEVQELVSIASEDPGVQGLVLDLDPLWLDLWRLNALLGPNTLYEELTRWRKQYPYAPRYEIFDRFRLGDEVALFPQPDLGWVPPYWNDYQWPELSGSPVVARIIRRPEHEVREMYFDPRRLRILYETRPVATSYEEPSRPLEGGISVGPFGEWAGGTLGGILRDSSGSFALTCAHVVHEGDEAVQPAVPDARRRGIVSRMPWLNRSRRINGSIGQCVAATTVLPSSDGCNPYRSDRINSLDAAIIKISPRVESVLQVRDVGPLAGIAGKGDVSVGMMVNVVGARSGRRMARLGGVAVFYEIEQGGAKYCFRDLVEIRHPSRSWGFFGTLRSPVQPGDSGGWILSAGPRGPQWCGVLIAGDGIVGYATFSEFVRKWYAELGLGDARISYSR